MTTSSQTAGQAKGRSSQKWSFYLWVGVVLAIAVAG